MVNIVHAEELIRKLRAITKIIDKTTGKRLSTLLKENHKDEDVNVSAGDYRRGYKDGLNAGIRVSTINEADIDINELAAAFEGENDEP